MFTSDFTSGSPNYRSLCRWRRKVVYLQTSPGGGAGGTGGGGAGGDQVQEPGGTAGTQEQLIQEVVVVESSKTGPGPPANISRIGAGGSGIVIVKELNKASGSWPLRAQFSARKSGTWVQKQISVSLDYLVVAGGGGGGGWIWLISFAGGGGGGAGGYRTSFPGGTKITLTGYGPLQVFPVVVGGGGAS
jgi:hypothetical protein